MLNTTGGSYFGGSAFNPYYTRPRGAYGPAQGYGASAAASSSPDGGTVIGGALLLFLGVQLIKKYQHTDFKHLLSPKHSPAKSPVQPKKQWEKPIEQATGPSYYGITSQKNRVSYATEPNGQEFSNALIDLGNQMRTSQSLQDALNHQETTGYEDFAIADDKEDGTTTWGQRYGVQSSQPFTGFNKADNGNPYKPRYVLCIGSGSKNEQFNQLCQTMHNEYDVPADHLLRANANTPAAIEAQLKRLKELTANEPNAEIVIISMPDHGNRKSPRKEDAPEGTHDLTFFDQAHQKEREKVTEARYKSLLNTYLGGKNTLTILTSCRAGAIVA